MANIRDREDFTVCEVKKRLDYNPDSGAFTWKVKTKRHAGVSWPGDVAGTIKSETGYMFLGLWGFQYRAHRLAFLMMTGEWPRDEVDHINGNRADNRWCNLRSATRPQNGRNTAIGTSNKSGCKGVSFRKDTSKWHARIVVDGKTILLGNFSLIEDAISARKTAEMKYHGIFARAA